MQCRGGGGVLCLHCTLVVGGGGEATGLRRERRGMGRAGATTALHCTGEAVFVGDVGEKVDRRTEMGEGGEVRARD